MSEEKPSRLQRTLFGLRNRIRFEIAERENDLREVQSFLVSSVPLSPLSFFRDASAAPITISDKSFLAINKLLSYIERTYSEETASVGSGVFAAVEDIRDILANGDSAVYISKGVSSLAPIVGDEDGNALVSTLFAVFAVFVFVYCFVYLPFSLLSRLVSF